MELLRVFRRSAGTLILLLVAAIVSITAAHAQDLQMRFHSIGRTGFFTEQDSTGFIWILGGGGVTRYDGVRFVEYLYDAADSTSVPGDAVEAIVASRRGGVWVGTLSNGIAWFNPATEKFHRYLPGEYVMRLMEASDGSVWAGTREGVIRLEPDSGDFQKFPVDAIWITQFLEDDDANVWIGVTDMTGDSPAFLYRYVPGADSLKRYLQTGTPIVDRLGNWRDWGVSAIGRSPDGDVLVGYRGVLRFDAEGDSLVVDEAFAPVANIPVREFLVDSRGYLWVATHFGLYRYTSLSEEPDHLFRGSLVLRVAEDDASIIWASTVRGSVIRIDPTELSYDFWRYDPTNPDSPPEGGINRLVVDRSGAAWIQGGTWFDPQAPAFKGIRATPEQEEGLTAGRVSSVLRSSDGALWIGTDGGGLFRRDPSTGAMTNYRTDPSDTGTLSSDAIWSLGDDENGNIWIGTLNNGVNRLDPSTGNVVRYSAGEVESRAGSITEVRSLPNGRVRVTDVWDVYELDPARGAGPSIFDRVETGPSASGRIIFKTATDSLGRLWMVTQNDGLYRVSADGRESVHFFHRAGDVGGLETNDLSTVAADRDGGIWISNMHGLFQVLPSDPDTLIVRKYSRSDGLPDNAVLNIVQDQAGILWVTSPTALTRLEPETGAVQIFDTESGLPSWLKSFIPNTAYLDETTGEIYIGAEGGLVAFHPDELALNYGTPDVVLSGFRRFNTDNEAGTPIEEPGIWKRNDVTLGYKDNIVEIDLATLSFRAPERNQYAYRLEGLSDSWINLGTRSTLTLTNLDAGRYTLWIRGANAAGNWSEDTRALEIIQRPPWWRSNVAYVIYGLLFLGGVIGVDRFQRRRVLQKERQAAALREADLKAETAEAQAREADAARRALQAENERKELELQKAKELEEAFRELEVAHEQLKTTQDQLVHSEKMASLGQLTAGIAHEIKNPLNFVNNFAEVNTELAEELQEAVQEMDVPEEFQDLIDDMLLNVQQIAKHGKRADSIVASMMEHAVASRGAREPADVNAQLEEYASLSLHAFQAQDERFECRLEYDLADGLPMVPVVAQELGRVWLNIFKNAYYAVHERRSSSAESFVPTVTVSTKPSPDGVEIRISDNGAGIPEDTIGKVFEPFYTTKPTGFGNTGLGLSLSHDIVAKGHGGSIRAENVDGGGAAFIVQLKAEAG